MLKGCDKPCCNAYYKIIIMDIAMPEKDGFDASKEILQIQSSVKDIVISDDKSL
jgi:YesN/AraC family two-component response regulator